MFQKGQFNLGLFATIVVSLVVAGAVLAYLSRKFEEREAKKAAATPAVTPAASTKPPVSNAAASTGT